jgi:hypothetical protein
LLVWQQHTRWSVLHIVQFMLLSAVPAHHLVWQQPNRQ